MRALLVLWLLAPQLVLADEPLTVEDAVRIARKNQPTLAQSKALLDAQKARDQQAVGGFFPGLTGSLSYNPQTANFAPTPGFVRAFRRTSGAITSLPDGTVVQCAPDAQGNFSPGCTPQPAAAAVPADYTLFNYWTAGVGIYWNVFDWGRTFYNWRAQKTGVEAQKLTVVATDQQIVLDVKLAFFLALAADAAVVVAEDAVRTQKQHADQARAFYQVGARTRIDVASADSDVANAELTLARAHGNRESARAQLAAALGEDHWRSWTLIAPPVEAVPLPPEPMLFDEALKNRPEPRELALRARSFEEIRKSVRGQFLPQLLFNIGPSWAGTEFTGLTTNYALAVTLAYPLVGMNPYLIVGQMREAEANRRAVLEQERGIRNSIRLEAANAHALVVTAREELLAAGKLMTAARERRDLAEGRYKAGVGSIIELSDAELVYVNAQFQEVQARLDLGQSQARLEHAVGRIAP